MIAPPAGWRRVAFVIIVGVILFPFAVFTIVNLLRGSIFNVVVGVALVLAVVRFLWCARVGACHDPALWIADADETGASPPPDADARVIRNSNVREVRLAFNRSGPQEGHLHVRLQLRGDAKEVLAYRTTQGGYLRAVRHGASIG